MEELKRGSRLGRYDLLLRIGRGGMATVWVARQRASRPEDERVVAIKSILAELADDDEFTKMFIDEGRLVQRIRHPNVVELYEVGQHEGVVFLAMEWVEGDSLHALIAEAGKRRPIPPEMAVRIIADAAAGLHAAHEIQNDRGESLGVVHRDVSPHNILIGADGKVKLVDFGVAKARERLTEATVAGQVKGKFGYMSPEQAAAHPVDRRSDVFALGIVLFELTTGRRLFKGESDAETLALVLSGEIPRPSAIDPKYPPALEKIVMKALSRSRRERFQTASEFEKALERYLKEDRVVVPRAGIAALLRRVLGERIEMRRQVVRAALKALDGGEKALLLSTDSAFATLGTDTTNLLTEISDTGSLPSSLGAHATTTGSYSGADVMFRSGLGALGHRMGQKKYRSLRWVVLALIVVIGVLCAYYWGYQPQFTLSVAVQPPLQERPRPSSEPKSYRSPSVDNGRKREVIDAGNQLDELPTISVEKLGKEEGASPRRPGTEH